MAEGILNHLAGDRFNAMSAGLDPGTVVNPKAVAVLNEIGIDISHHQPKNLDVYLGKIPVLHMVTVCDNAQQSCPRIWPGLLEKHRHHWMLDNPASVEGTEEEKMQAFRKLRDDLVDRIKAWIETISV
jgi:arsenate reductase